MTTPIEPVLRAEEHDSLRNGALSEVSLTGIADILTNPYEHDEAKSAARIIAAMNARLPDSDCRKITRKHVALLRWAATVVEVEALGDSKVAGHTVAIHGLADALDSYLRPEEP